MKASTYLIMTTTMIALIACSLAFVAYKISVSVDYIQKNIEQALPIIKSASVVVAESELLKNVPEAQEILKQEDEKALVQAATTPVVVTALEALKMQLNDVLPLIKIKDVHYEVDADEEKTILINCSFGINIHISGHEFNHLITTQRERHTLKFVCD